MGFVWEPAFVDNLSLTVDYWKIKISEAVSSPTANQVVQGCFSTTLNPGFAYNAFCQLIQRDPLNGGLNGTGSRGVSTQSSNLGAYHYSGVDVGVAYRLPLSALGAPTLGRLDFSLQASLVQKADVQTLPTVATIEQAGYYGVNTGTPYAKTKFTQRTTWTFGNSSIGYNWRYIGGTQAEPGTVALDQYKTIKPYNYIDLSLSTTVFKALKLGLTINNLFDKDPPFVGTGISGGAVNFGNTMPTQYDVIGRRYTVTAQLNF